MTDADVALGKIDPAALRRRHDRARRRRGRSAALAARDRHSRSSWTQCSRLRRRRDRRREHGQRRPRARRRARRRHRRAHADRLRRRRAAARRAAWPRSSASRASSCRRMPASARRSASCARRSPTSWSARATCGSSRFDAAAANALLADMDAARRCRTRASAAGGRPARGDAVRLHALCRARATRSRLRCPTARWRQATPRRCRAASSASTAGCSPATSPAREIEIMSWLVLATTSAEPPARLAGGAGAGGAPKPLGERSVFDARLGRRVDGAGLRARPPGAGRGARRPGAGASRTARRPTSSPQLRR